MKGLTCEEVMEIYTKERYHPSHLVAANYFCPLDSCMKNSRKQLHNDCLSCKYLEDIDKWGDPDDEEDPMDWTELVEVVNQKRLIRSAVIKDKELQTKLAEREVRNGY
jgi:hypothetical protein